MAAPQLIVLDELDAVGTLVELSATIAAVLSDTELVEVRPHGGGVWRLLPRGKVGAVRVGDLQVQVNPKEKVGLAHLLFLLGYAGDPGFRPEQVDGVRDDELWPALGHSLVQSVEQALALGVLQGYQTRDESLRTVRGRIRFGDQLKARPGLLMPIEITHDEFSLDIPENQIVLAAVHVMLGVPRLNPEIRRRLIHLTGPLSGVSRLRRGSPMPRWQPSRRNARYYGALRLSEIVLRYAAVKPADGGIEVASFVVTMWKVFEDFVSTALVEALRSVPGRTALQLPARLAGAGDWRSGSIPMNVDIVHLDPNGVPRVVYDAKYKAASVTGEYAGADHYQMLAYCTALQVPQAWLVYAAGAGEKRVRRIKNSGIEVVEFPLDLAKPPRQILARIAELAQASTGWVGRRFEPALIGSAVGD